MKIPVVSSLVVPLRELAEFATAWAVMLERTQPTHYATEVWREELEKLMHIAMKETGTGGQHTRTWDSLIAQRAAEHGAAIGMTPEQIAEDQRKRELHAAKHRQPEQKQPNGGTQWLRAAHDTAAVALLRAWLRKHQGADALSQATRKWLGVNGEDIGGFEVGDFEQEAGRIDREETDADSKQPDPIPTKQQLIDAIMADWPNAVIKEPSTMYAWAETPIKTWIKLSRFRQLAHATLQRGHGVFYSPMEGVHGYRYGLEPSEYVSIMGFSEL